MDAPSPAPGTVSGFQLTGLLQLPSPAAPVQVCAIPRAGASPRQPAAIASDQPLSIDLDMMFPPTIFRQTGNLSFDRGKGIARERTGRGAPAERLCRTFFPFFFFPF